MVLVFTLTSTSSCYRPTSMEPAMITVHRLLGWGLWRALRSELQFCLSYMKEPT